jgi:ABC-2 type transport system permease protein
VSGAWWWPVADGWRLWLVYAGASLRGQIQYRSSFVIGILGQFLVTVIEFLAVWTLFDRFGGLDGWTLPEVAVFYGVAHISLAWADVLATGFDHAGELIRTGGLDRLLLRPRSTVLQLIGHRFEARRFGRLAQGAAMLVWGLSAGGGAIRGAGWLLVLGAVVGGGCLFLALFVLRGTLSIWTVQSLELINAATYGGVQAAQYPMSIYDRWFRRFFTYFVPLLAVIYLPVVTALGRPDPLGLPTWIGWVSWVVGPLSLVGAVHMWGVGLRHYTSTGS